MTEHAKIVMQALRKAPGFKNVEVKSITRLGGLTNLVHRVDIKDRSVIVRIAGSGTDEYIDRGIELHNAKAAAKAAFLPM